MLHKLLILSLFTITYTVIAMDDPANHQIPVIPSGKSDAPEKTKPEALEKNIRSAPNSASSATPLAPWGDEVKSKLMKMFLESLPIDPDTGNTALHYAAAMPEVPDLITLMFQKKPELKNLIDHYNNQGVTPLLLAIVKSNEGAVIALIHHGANVELQGKEEVARPSK